jgi:hypothetical protein
VALEYAVDHHETLAIHLIGYETEEETSRAEEGAFVNENVAAAPTTARGRS